MIQSIVERFHDIHQSVYQHSAPDSQTEFTAFHMVYSQKPMPTPILRELSPRGEATPKWHQAYFDEYKAFVDTPVYERTALAPEQKLVGPAIVEQADTTTVIYPDQEARVDKWGNLIVRRKWL